MTDNQKYFLHLLSSHLNNEKPAAPNSVSWKEIFQLGEAHNLTGMLCLAIKELPAENRPVKAMSYFNQALGQTIQSCELKYNAINCLKSLLNQAGINHVILKGGAIRHLYPVPEVRTSGDTDLVVDKIYFSKIKDILCSNNFIITSEQDNQLVFNYNNQEFQFKSYFDCLKETDRTIFSINNCEIVEGCTYYLNPTYSLLYVINHLLKHIKGGGVGVRQLMDVDVIIRNLEIDYDLFWSLIDKMNLRNSTSIILSITKQLFNTPINIDYHVSDELFDNLMSVILVGGVFGYGISDNGTVRLAKQGSKFKALLDMFFPSKDYIYNTYLYANKFHFLLPIAYVHRFFEAVLKRGKSNRKYINSILSNNENATQLTKIYSELEI